MCRSFGTMHLLFIFIYQYQWSTPMMSSFSIRFHLSSSSFSCMCEWWYGNETCSKKMCYVWRHIFIKYDWWCSKWHLSIFVVVLVACMESPFGNVLEYISIVSVFGATWFAWQVFASFEAVHRTFFLVLQYTFLFCLVLCVFHFIREKNEKSKKKLVLFSLLISRYHRYLPYKSTNTQLSLVHCLWSY